MYINDNPATILLPFSICILYYHLCNKITSKVYQALCHIAQVNIHREIIESQNCRSWKGRQEIIESKTHAKAGILQ